MIRSKRLLMSFCVVLLAASAAYADEPSKTDDAAGCPFVEAESACGTGKCEVCARCDAEDCGTEECDGGTCAGCDALKAECAKCGQAEKDCACKHGCEAEESAHGGCEKCGAGGD